MRRNDGKSLKENASKGEGESKRRDKEEERNKTRMKGGACDRERGGQRRGRESDEKFLFQSFGRRADV